MVRERRILFHCCMIALVFLSGIINRGNAQEASPFIVVDQFGYLPDAQKIAVIRNPQIGYDGDESYSPGGNITLVNAISSENVLSGSPMVWNSGNTDASSGDKAWWFDFSSVTTPGKYYVLDTENNTRSFEFEIAHDVYNEVLKHAVRTFFYQRVGFPKEAQYAGAGWADGASHIGNLQDKNCRLFSNPNSASTEMDVSGGWYDAGDYNKYTNWTANYVTEMMKAYLENPGAWGDDYNIPESGNGIPDLIDEAKWGVDHLLRLQKEDGSVLSIVDESHASPPSSATGQSLYGPPSTSATLNTAAALAISSKVFKMLGMTDYSTELEAKAIHAWEWAEANPDVLFRNNDPDYDSEGIGAGQQEEDDYQRSMTKLEAACFLFDVTKDGEYKNYFDANYTDSHLIQWNFAYPFEAANQEVLLYYTLIPEATSSVADNILAVYENAMINGSENFPAYYEHKDPYLAHLQDYTWGSNAVKSHQGNMFFNLISFDVDTSVETDAHDAAQNYIHYLHGVNPLNMTYLSNMYEYGGDNCVNEFYHTWFYDGSAKWDRVGESTYGPPPGFLTGGPNPSYDRDGCCPDGCGSAENNAVCNSEDLVPPLDQPSQKSYKDFNTSWPLNSWSVTENSCGYQVSYIRLLSKFVDASYDCHGDKDGAAFIDACGQCAGGNTGNEPITDPEECEGTITGLNDEKFWEGFSIYPNPATKVLFIHPGRNLKYKARILNITGKVMMTKKLNGDTTLDVKDLPAGSYIIRIESDSQILTKKFMIR